MPSYTEKLFTAQDGLRLYFRDYGEANRATTPILCLSGLTRNSKDFHRTAERLSKTHRVVAMDYRGRGQSERDSDPYNYIPTTYLNDARHLLTLLGLHKVIIIGTSLGGLLAMGMALVMPSAIKAVILNDIGPEVANNGRERIMEYIGTDTSPADWDAAAAELREKFPTLSLRSDQEWREAAEATYRIDDDGVFHPDWDLKMVKPLLRDGDLPDLWPLFYALKQIPVLGIRGEVSDLLLPETFERMANSHPDFTSVTIPETGHVPSLWEPQSEAAIDGFLARL